MADEMAKVEEAEANLEKAQQNYREATKVHFPKWVEVDASYVVRQGDHVVVQDFSEYHVDRSDKVTVLVHDENEEKKAASAKPVATEKSVDHEPAEKPAA